MVDTQTFSLGGVHNFWSNTEGDNTPESYLMYPERSGFLARIFEDHIPKSHNILEVGCNSGRNLAVLYEMGYKKLHGIDINEKAVDMANTRYPHIQFEVATVEEYVKDMPKYKTIFTMAVLEHIHPDSEFIFKHLADNSGYLVTIEDEKTFTTRHFPRNYKKVFEKLGKKQIKEFRNVRSQGKGFVARIFK